MSSAMFVSAKVPVQLKAFQRARAGAAGSHPLRTVTTATTSLRARVTPFEKAFGKTVSPSPAPASYQAAAPSFAAAPAGVPAEYAGLSQTQIDFMERKRVEQGLPPLASAAPSATVFSATPAASGGAPAEYAGLSQTQIEFMQRKRAEQGLAPLGGAAAAAPAAFGSPGAEPVACIPDNETFARVAPLAYFAFDLLTPKGPRTNVDHGDPHDFTRPFTKVADVSSGSWGCTEGGWDSPNKRPSTEFFYVLSGSGCVTDPDGTRHPFGPGDNVLLPKGWYGRWDIYEKIHKVWAVHVHPDVPGAAPTPVVRSTTELARAMGQLTPRTNVSHGTPAQASSYMYDVGNTAVGYWECTPGSFPSGPKATTEIFHVLEGVFFLTNADGSARRCGPGDMVVLPKGWVGHWDIIETVKKVWVDISD